MLRIPAPEIEAAVIQAVRQELSGATEADNQITANSPPEELGAFLEQRLERVLVGTDRLQITVWISETSGSHRITIPWIRPAVTRKRNIIVPHSEVSKTDRPIRSDSRARLVEGIAKGRLWLNQLISGEVTGTKERAARERCSDRQIRMTVSLAFLSPMIIKAAVDGALPSDSGIAKLTSMPADWEEQVQVISGSQH